MKVLKVVHLFFVLPLLLFCSACWDMKEINQLAIVNVVGADKDSKTGEVTAYYQVINPTGISNLICNATS